MLHCPLIVEVQTVIVCPARFPVPQVSLLQFPIHPPEVLGLSLLSPDCPTHLLTGFHFCHQLCSELTFPAHLLTCLHFPHQLHPIYMGPVPLFLDEFVCVALWPCALHGGGGYYREQNMSGPLQLLSFKRAGEWRAQSANARFIDQQTITPLFFLKKLKVATPCNILKNWNGTEGGFPL